MGKVAVGSVRQKILIEGDENLLESYELLIQDSDDFKMILKERDEHGQIKTYAVVPIEEYIESLEGAYTEGLSNKKESNE